MALVKCDGVCKSYGKNSILKNINLEIPKGKIIGLLGPNGSGKTTLIKIINGLLETNSGTVLVNGEKIGINSKKVISYLPERPYVNFDSDTAYKLLEKLNLNPNDKLNTMSKGMKEKVQLILVMSRKADLYILDEPIGGVDPATRDYILDTILTNFNDGASVIISTHLISDIEKILDEVIFIKEGSIYLTGDADELRTSKGMSIDEIFREEFKC